MTGVIAVALSGGVDSSTAAALLSRAGHRCFGVTMRLLGAAPAADAPARLPGAAAASARCCGGEDTEVARSAAARLNLPFYVLDFEEEFRALVIDDFVSSYRAGRTPLPCAHCNTRLKFDSLLARVRGLGATRLATGHYARLGIDAASGRVTLGRAADRAKDQSYFLFGMTQEVLAQVLFPLADLRKEQVRELARQHGLPNADKPESQDICFVPDGDTRGFLARSGAGEPGEIVGTDGRPLGSHAGVSGFTVGQRRGIGLPGRERSYVVALEASRRRVVVGRREEAEALRFETGPVNWVSRDRPSRAVELEVQVRHRQTPVPARVEPLAGGRARVVTSRALVAPVGQAAVFYDGDLLAGGAWIEAVERGPAVEAAAVSG